MPNRSNIGLGWSLCLLILSCAAVAVAGGMGTLPTVPLAAETPIGPKPKEWGQVVNGLRCSIKTEKAVYRPGELIRVKFGFQNVGEETIYHKSYEESVLSVEGKRIWFKEVNKWPILFRVEVRAADGQKYTLTHSPPLPVRRTYLELEPGSSLGAWSTLNYWWYFERYDDRGRLVGPSLKEILARPGQLQLTGVYYNWGKGSEPSGVLFWTGDVISNTVELTVLPQDARK